MTRLAGRLARRGLLAELLIMLLLTEASECRWRLR